MKRKLRFLHNYLSLTLAALWLMQAVTGALLVFHWELDDWAVSGPQRHLHPVRFGGRPQHVGVPKFNAPAGTRIY